MAEIVHDIHDGKVDPSGLALPVRRRCVAHLLYEGFSVQETAQLMQVSERTVSRDRSDARADNALPPDIHLGDQLLGEFQCYTLGSIQRLIRLAKESSTPPYARLWAEESINRMYQRLMDMALKMNYINDGMDRLIEQVETDPILIAAEEAKMEAMGRELRRQFYGDLEDEDAEILGP